jgi:hypothetical protein
LGKSSENNIAFVWSVLSEPCWRIAMKQVELADHAAVHHPVGEFGVQAGQVTLKHRAVHLAEAVNVDRGVCEERREAGHCPGSRALGALALAPPSQGA